MSSVRLLKDGPKGKKGDVISVPFGAGKDLVAAGSGEYLQQPASVVTKNVAKPSAEALHAAEIVRLNQHHANVLAEVKADAAEKMKAIEDAHAEQLTKVSGDLEAAQKLLTEKQAKAK
jgi:hypothetical protein